MDDPNDSADLTAPSGAPVRRRRGPRPDLTLTPSAGAVSASAGRALTVGETPLVTSRSLGPLLGIESLRFKLESLQPTGSWLDRGAAQLVSEAEPRGGAWLAVVGSGPLSQSLAAQCARVGRQLVVLTPSGDAGSLLWLDALGAQIMRVDVDEATLHAALPAICADIGGQYVDGSVAQFHAGWSDVQREISGAAGTDALIALSSLLGQEADWFAEDHRLGQVAMPLPFDGLDARAERRVSAVVAVADTASTPPPAGGVICQRVTAREAAAAQRLLAREEGLLTSTWGAAGLAALIRVVQDDRRQTPRTRRLPRDLTAVVVVTGERAEAGGPPIAPDALPQASVALSDIRAQLSRLLEPHAHRARSEHRP